MHAMERKLSLNERATLIKLHRKERDKRVCDRIKAVLAYDDGYSYAEIAKILLLDDETIRRHIIDYFDKNKVAPENGGSESHLNKAESLKLKAHLAEITYLYVKDICAYVKSAFHKHYSISGMTKWLHANGFRYKKPHAVPAKADKEQQKKFIAFYKRLKAKAGKEEPIYFADGVHPQHQTHLTYGWIQKGERKAIPTTGKQYRLNFMGGICLDGHRFFYQQSDKIDAESIALFLLSLRKRHPEKCIIHLIWDNAGYHRDKAIQAFAEGLGIKLHYLPPYSPNLNPIERLWKLMHESVTYNKYYASFTEFTDATIDFFKSIGRKKSILRSRVTDNFRVLHSPILAS
jgi:transposase